MTIFNFFNR